MSNTTLLVRKDRLPTARLATAEDSPLAPGQVRVRVDAFALTANNITYAAFGDAMHYWQFFPSGEEGWGIVPVWGFGTVVQSLHPAWPSASACGATGRWRQRRAAAAAPDRARLRRWRTAPRRAACRLQPVPALQPGPVLHARQRGPAGLLRPLFTTSWLIDDFLADNDFFGASGCCSPARRARRPYGTAFQLQQRAGIERIGFTSAANKAFCESLGCYDRVLAYEELDQLDAATKPACTSTSPATPLCARAMHQRFGEPALQLRRRRDARRRSWAARGTCPARSLTLFFAPAQAKKRSRTGARRR
jgi:hypothetical protein